MDGQGIADLLNREYRCYFGSLSPVKVTRAFVVNDAFEMSGAFRRLYRSVREVVRRPNIMELSNIMEDIISS